MTMDSPAQTKRRDERAYTSPLWVNGVPQILIICDRSRNCKRNREPEASSGDYGVVLRNSWANNVPQHREQPAAGSAAATIPHAVRKVDVRFWRQVMVLQKDVLSDLGRT
ncbi:hypothetical protein B0T13DRAFT_447210 [Neurospora crassa]|nr:hypothetical protein B0T13DRAFT_447210 [Neurospora crassa]